MTQQSEALRLADALEEKDYPPRRAAAAELRRLHAVNAHLLKALEVEREAVCRIVTGLCISDNNAEEINRAIRARGQA